MVAALRKSRGDGRSVDGRHVGPCIGFFWGQRRVFFPLSFLSLSCCFVVSEQWLPTLIFSLCFRSFFFFMLAQRRPLPSLKMRRAASRLAALAARQQRLNSHALASSSYSSCSCSSSSAGAAGCSSMPLMRRLSTNSPVLSLTFRRRFLHSAAALGSDAGSSSNLSSLRASLAAGIDEKDEGDTRFASASGGGGGGGDGGSLSPSPPSSPTQEPPPRRRAREPDFTQLAALAASLAARAVPGRVDDVVGVDDFTVAVKLRVRPLLEIVLKSSTTSSSSSSSSSSSPYDLETAWLWVCWKPGAARACLGPEPPRGSPADGFASTARLREELRGRVLSSVALRQRWERVLVLAFSSRNNDEANAKGGEGARGSYGDEGHGEDDPYSPRSAASRRTKSSAAAANRQLSAAVRGGGGGREKNADGDDEAPDRLLFLEVMGRRSNMILTDVERFVPTRGNAEFALVAAEAAALNELARRSGLRASGRKSLLKERQKAAAAVAAAAAAAAKGKAGGSTKRGKRGAANAAAAAEAAAAALTAAEEGEEQEGNAGAAAAATDALPLPLPSRIKPPSLKNLPPLPHPIRIPSFYAASPAAAAAAASYPPTSEGEAASLGISGDATSAFSSSSSSSSSGGDASPARSRATWMESPFSVPRLSPPASTARTGKILALGRSVPRSASQSRPLAVGGKYFPPPGLLSSGGGRLEPGMSETREVWRSNVLGAAAAARARTQEYLERKSKEEAAEAAARRRRRRRSGASPDDDGSDGDGDSDGGGGGGGNNKLELELEGEQGEKGGDGSGGGDGGDATEALPPPPPPPPVAVVNVVSALVNAYGGVSPALAHELCWAAGIPGNGGGQDPADDVEGLLSEADWKRLHAVWRNWLCAVADARFAPGEGPDGAPSVLGGGVLLLESRGDFAAPSEPCDVPSLLAAARKVDLALRESLVVSFYLFIIYFFSLLPLPLLLLFLSLPKMLRKSN